MSGIHLSSPRSPRATIAATDLVFDRQRNGGTDVLPEPRVDGPVLPRPSITSVRPPDRCWSTLKSSAILTGSLVVINVVAVDRMMRSVCAAMYPSNVVGDDGTKGGLWCSPV